MENQQSEQPEVAPNKIEKFLKVIGPGLVTGASDDDPSGIATYSQAGAQFGLSTLWTALLTAPLMAAIQGICARIGIVTGQGLTVTIRQHYSRSLLYIMLAFSFPAITLNIGADIQGMGAVAHMMLPRIPVAVFCVGFTAILMFIIIRYPYRKIALILKWLCLSLLLYVFVPFMVKQDWPAVARNTIIPTLKFNKEFISILVALLGTTTCSWRWAYSVRAYWPFPYSPGRNHTCWQKLLAGSQA